MQEADLIRGKGATETVELRSVLHGSAAGGGGREEEKRSPAVEEAGVGGGLRWRQLGWRGSIQRGKRWVGGDRSREEEEEEESWEFSLSCERVMDLAARAPDLAGRRFPLEVAGGGGTQGRVER